MIACGEGEEFLQFLIDSSPDGMRVIDSEFTVVNANRAFCRQVGRSRDEVVGAPCYVSSHNRTEPCPPTLVTCPLVEIERQPVPVKSPHRHVRPDGQDLLVEVYAAPLEVEIDGQPKHLIVESIRDLTTEVRLSHEHRLSEIGQLAAGVAHEILNPLASARLSLQSLLRELRDNNGEFGEAQYYLRVTEVNRLIDAVAPSDMTVLIEGESGVGKELVAREVHERSRRADRNYVPVDCCTLQEQLFESELFGHEKGAFTSADRLKKGLIEGAHGGTLFLDEIGEIGPAVQAKLLRVLETGQFRRLGGEKDLSSDVRVVAATNRSLEEMVDQGDFRADLYFRINAFTLNVPPLRERRSDIPISVEHFISHHDFSRRIEKTVAAEAMKRLIGYQWPGNVRELRNVVERAIILSGGRRQINSEDMGLKAGNGANNVPLTLSFDHEPTMEEVSRQYLGYLLEKYSGNRLTVARALGVSERNIYRLINKFELYS